MTSHRYILAYDVSDDQLRKRIRSHCRAYGGHRQYSVFEFEFRDPTKTEFLTELESLCDGADTEVDIRLYGIASETTVAETGSADSDDPANIV